MLSFSEFNFRHSTLMVFAHASLVFPSTVLLLSCFFRVLLVIGVFITRGLARSAPLCQARVVLNGV